MKHVSAEPRWRLRALLPSDGAKAAKPHVLFRPGFLGHRAASCPGALICPRRPTPLLIRARWEKAAGTGPGLTQLLQCWIKGGAPSLTHRDPGGRNPLSGRAAGCRCSGGEPALPQRVRTHEAPGGAHAVLPGLPPLLPPGCSGPPPAGACPGCPGGGRGPAAPARLKQCGLSLRLLHSFPARVPRTLSWGTEGLLEGLFLGPGVGARSQAPWEGWAGPTQSPTEIPPGMNVSRRIHSLRAHRPKAPSVAGPGRPRACSTKPGWAQEERLPAAHTIYTVVILALLMLVLGVWARRDM
ncbi:uncharacterized protein ACOB8E_000949 [Sarcophilus harrisii]